MKNEGASAKKIEKRKVLHGNWFLSSKVCKFKASLKHHAILQVLDICILLGEAGGLNLDELSLSLDQLIFSFYGLCLHHEFDSIIKLIVFSVLVLLL